MARLKFIRLKTLDQECRCCGKGTQHVCDDCNDKLHNGYAFMIEVKDSSTEKRKKPTGYAIAFKAAQVVNIEPAIYFIKQTEMKEFLGDDYNNYRATAGKFIQGKLQIRHNAHQQSTAGSRRAVELCDTAL